MRYRIVYILLLVAAVSGCKKTTTTVTYDVTDATIRTFSLTANDSFPGLAAATFTIESLSDTGLIYPTNGDSLRYGTRLTAVSPRITFNSRPAAALYYIGDTVKNYTGYDTIDLTKEPVYLRVYAADRTNQKYYRIRAYAHQIDPDKYVYSLLNDNIMDAGLMQVCEADNKFYAFVADGTQIQLSQSSDGKQWTEAVSVNGLNVECNVRQIVYDKPSKSFFYAQNGDYYISSDGISWTKKALTSTYNIIATIMSYDEKVWLLGEKEAQHALLAYNTATDKIEYEGFAPLTFPISDFATATYLSEGGRAHAIVMGGYDKKGGIVSSLWSIEKLGDTFSIIDLSTSRYHQPAITGATIVYYAGKLFRIGGKNNDGEYTAIAESISEGLIWQPMDTAHLILPQEKTMRYRMTAIVKGQNIYIFGGQNNTQSFSDVYVTRLNSIDWK